MAIRKYILDSILTAVRMRPGRWVLSKDLINEVEEKTGKHLNPRSIGRYLLVLGEENQVDRRRVKQNQSLYEYRSKVPPNCCKYGHIIVNDTHCIACGAWYG